MREIKFRAWLKLEEKMREVQKIEFDDFGHIHTVGWFGEKGEMLFNVSNAEVRRTIELMQFTGLKDKKGKEIYEGDIVLADWLDGGEIQDEVKPYEVYFDTGFSIKLESFDYYSHLIDPESMYLEVIGNIYENPELLKETK